MSKKQAEEVMRQAKEKRERGETLFDDDKRAFARAAAKVGLVKCRATNALGGKGCGSTNVRLNVPRKNSMQFKCKDCGKTFYYKINELRAMLQKAAPEKAPMEMADAEQDEQQMQMLRANHTFNMNQMNDNNNINNLNNLNDLNNNNFRNEEVDHFRMYFDEEEVYSFSMDSENDAANDNPNKPREEKERWEDYENQERYVPGPGMMGYVAPQDAGATREVSIDSGAHFVGNPQPMLEDSSDTVSDENMQMRDGDRPLENQTRHNVVRSAFMPPDVSHEVIVGDDSNNLWHRDAANEKDESIWRLGNQSMNQNNQPQQNFVDDDAAYFGMEFDDDNGTDIFHIEAMTERQNQTSEIRRMEERLEEEPWREEIRNGSHAGHNVIFTGRSPEGFIYHCADCDKNFISQF